MAKMKAFTREFCLESDNILLKINQNIEGDVGCVVWDAALVLSAYLDCENKRNNFFLKGKNVVELGSGVGCVGLAAACLGANVTVTDLPEVITYLVNNISENQKAVEHGGGNIKALAVDWTKGDATLRSPDFLLLADCVYYGEALQPLVNMIRTLAGPNTEVLITQELRDSAIQEKLWKQFREKLNDHFDIFLIPKENQHHIYCSPDIVLLKLLKKIR